MRTTGIIVLAKGYDPDQVEPGYGEVIPKDLLLWPCKMAETIVYNDEIWDDFYPLEETSLGITDAFTQSTIAHEVGHSINMEDVSLGTGRWTIMLDSYANGDPLEPTWYVTNGVQMSFDLIDEGLIKLFQ